MPAGQVDLVIEQGADFTKQFVWQSNGVAVPLTGYTAKMQIRKKVADTTVLLELSTANSRISLVSPGQINLAVTAAVTGALDFTEAVYDLELTSGGGVVTRLLKGAVTLDKQVTRE